MIEFLHRLLGLSKPYRLRLALGIAFGFLSGLVDPLLMLVIPLVGLVVFTGEGADSAETVLKNLSPWLQTVAHTIAAWFTQSGSSPTAAVKILVILLIPLMFILRGLFTYLNVYCLQWVAIRAITDLRTRLFAHLQNLSVGFFVQSRTGDLMSRINSDTISLQNTITAPLAVVVKDPVTVMGCLIVLLIFGRQAHAGHIADFSRLSHPHRHLQPQSAQIQRHHPKQLLRTVNRDARILHRQPHHQGLQP